MKGVRQEGEGVGRDEGDEMKEKGNEIRGGGREEVVRELCAREWVSCQSNG